MGAWERCATGLGSVTLMQCVVSALHKAGLTWASSITSFSTSPPAFKTTCHPQAQQIILRQSCLGTTPPGSTTSRNTGKCTYANQPNNVRVLAARGRQKSSLRPCVHGFRGRWLIHWPGCCCPCGGLAASNWSIEHLHRAGAARQSAVAAGQAFKEGGGCVRRSHTDACTHCHLDMTARDTAPCVVHTALPQYPVTHTTENLMGKQAAP